MVFSQRQQLSRTNSEHGNMATWQHGNYSKIELYETLHFHIKQSVYSVYLYISTIKLLIEERMEQEWKV